MEKAIKAAALDIKEVVKSLSLEKLLKLEKISLTVTPSWEGRACTFQYALNKDKPRALAGMGLLVATCMEEERGHLAANAQVAWHEEKHVDYYGQAQNLLDECARIESGLPGGFHHYILAELLRDMTSRAMGMSDTRTAEEIEQANSLFLSAMQELKEHEVITGPASSYFSYCQTVWIGPEQLGPLTRHRQKLPLPDKQTLTRYLEACPGGCDVAEVMLMKHRHLNAKLCSYPVTLPVDFGFGISRTLNGEVTIRNPRQQASANETARSR